METSERASEGVKNPNGKNTLPGVPPPAPGSSPSELPTAAEREEITRPEHDVPESRRRGEYPTVPGGGNNRMSGGRDAASAYVGVRTVTPHLTAVTSGSTVSIRIEDKLANESRRHATEPRLPRSVSVAPPPPLRDPEARTKGVALLVAALALSVGGLAALLLHEPASEPVTWDHGIDGHPASIEQAPGGAAKVPDPAPVTTKIVPRTRNDAKTGPSGTLAAASATSGAPQLASPIASSPATPARQPTSAASPRAPTHPAPLSSAATAPKKTTPRAPESAPEAPQHENWLE